MPNLVLHHPPLTSFLSHLPSSSSSSSSSFPIQTQKSTVSFPSTNHTVLLRWRPNTIRYMVNPRRVAMVAKQIKKELSDMLLTDKDTFLMNRLWGGTLSWRTHGCSAGVLVSRATTNEEHVALVKARQIFDSRGNPIVERDQMKWQQSDHHDQQQQQIQYNFGGDELSKVFSLPIHAQGLQSLLNGNRTVKLDPSS
ncbi:hypothetical protein ACFX13_001750 [Malus domestica]